MPLDKCNKTIVRVWTSKNNKDFPGHNVGHVSIELNYRANETHYISLWPVPFTEEQKKQYMKAKTLEKNYLQYFLERSPNFKQTYEEDYKAEGNSCPQVIVCLYSLSISEMLDEWYELRKQTNGWRLIGSNMFIEKIEEKAIVTKYKIMETQKNIVENCASLALKILKSGGIQSLIDTPVKSTLDYRTSSCVSPDDIVDLLISAKKIELDKHKETLEFKDETNISCSSNRSGSWCHIS